MKFGAKNLILLATFILIESLAVCAQWHEPSWNFSSTSAYARFVCSTNLYAAPQTFVITNAQIISYTNGICDGVTNFAFPIFTNIVSTQKFLCAIGPDTNAMDAPVFAWSLNYSTNVGHTNAQLVGYTYTATGTTERVATNLVLDAAGRRDLDCYNALAERSGAIAISNQFAPRFYHNHFENVVAAKDFATLLACAYLDARLATNGNFAAWIQNVTDWTNYFSTDMLPTFSADVSPHGDKQRAGENLARAAYTNCPTNFFALTLYRSIDQTNGVPQIVICTNTVTGNGTNGQIFTQQTFATWGEPWTIIGTNGQRVTRASTNNSMATNTVSGDYGQWRLRGAITNLCYTAIPDYELFKTNKSAGFLGDKYYYADSAAAKTDVATNWPSAWANGDGLASLNVGTFLFVMPDGTIFNAGAYSEQVSLFYTNAWTGATFAVQSYYIPYALGIPDYGTTAISNVFDNCGFFTNGYAVAYVPELSGAGGTNGAWRAASWWGDMAATPTLPPWCSDTPAAAELIYTRGVRVFFYGVVKWDFLYK